MTMTDPVHSPAAAALRSGLSLESSTVRMVLMRLRVAQDTLLPAASTTAWRGVAERAQAVAVAEIRSLLDHAAAALVAAQSNVDSAIWALPSID